MSGDLFNKMTPATGVGVGKQLAKETNDKFEKPSEGDLFGSMQEKKTPVWQQTANTSDKANQHNIDVNEYSPYIKEGVFDNSALDKTRAENQGWVEQTAHSVGRTIGSEIIGGTISSIGALLELPVAAGEEITGGDADFSNFITQLGDDISKATNKALPIYRTDPNKSFNLSDFGWWAEMMPSVASSVSMLIPATGVVKGAGFLAKLTGLADKVGDSAKYWSKLALGAAASRQAENFRESVQIFNQSKADALQQFANPDEWNKILQSDVAKELSDEGREVTPENLANFIASKGAWKSYAINSLNIGFDALQFAPILKGFKAGTRTNGFGTAANVLEANATRQLSKFDRIAGRLNPVISPIGRQLSEGVEEGINTIGSGEGQKYVEGLLGQQGYHKDYSEDGNFWESVAWGIGGGMAHEGAITGMNLMSDANNSPQSNKGKIAEIAGRQVILQSYAAKMKDIQDSAAPDDEKKVALANIKAEMSFDLGLRAAKSGNVDLLLEQLQDSKFRQKLVDLGVSDEKDVAKAIENTRKDILKAEDLYNKHFNRLQTSDLTQAARSRLMGMSMATEYSITKNQQYIDKLNGELGQLQSTESHKALNLGIDALNTVDTQALLVAKVQLTNQLAHLATKPNSADTIERTKRAMEKVDTLLEEKAKITNPVDISAVDPRIIDNKAEKFLYESTNGVLVEELGKLQSKEGEKEVEANIKKQQDEAKEKALNDFKKNIEASRTVQELEDLDKRTSDKEAKQLIKDKIKKLKDEETQKQRELNVQRTQEDTRLKSEGLEEITGDESQYTDIQEHTVTGTKYGKKVGSSFPAPTGKNQGQEEQTEPKEKLVPVTGELKKGDVIRNKTTGVSYTLAGAKNGNYGFYVEEEGVKKRAGITPEQYEEYEQVLPTDAIIEEEVNDINEEQQEREDIISEQQEQEIKPEQEAEKEQEVEAELAEVIEEQKEIELTLEQKVENIEKRREEELAKRKKAAKNIAGVPGDAYNKIIDKINAKYDAELAELISEQKEGESGSPENNKNSTETESVEILQSENTETEQFVFPEQVGNFAISVFGLNSYAFERNADGDIIIKDNFDDAAYSAYEAREGDFVTVHVNTNPKFLNAKSNNIDDIPIIFKDSKGRIIGALNTVNQKKGFTNSEESLEELKAIREVVYEAHKLQPNGEALFSLQITAKTLGSILNIETTRNLSETFGDNILIGTGKGTGIHIALNNTAEVDHIVGEKGDVTSGKHYVLIDSPNSNKKIAVPVVNGSLDKGSSEAVISLMKDMAKALKKGDSFSSDEVRAIRDAIDEITMVSKNDKDKGFYVTDNVFYLNFKDESGNKHQIKVYFKNQDGTFKSGFNVQYKDAKGNTVTLNHTEHGAKIATVLNRALSNMYRNVKADKLNKGGEYKSPIDGKIYNNYNEFVATTGALKSNVGKVMDSKGNTISHHHKGTVGQNLVVRVGGKVSNAAKLSTKAKKAKAKTNKNKAAKNNEYTPSTELMALEDVSKEQVVLKRGEVLVYEVVNTTNEEGNAKQVRRAVAGKLIKVVGFEDFQFFKVRNSSFVIEASTGKSVGNVTNLKNAPKELAEKLSDIGREKVVSIVNSTLEEMRKVDAEPTIIAEESKEVEPAIEPIAKRGSGNKVNINLKGKAREATNITDYQKIQEEKVKQWWTDTFPNVDLAIVDGFINNGGKLAFGLFHDAMVSLSNVAEVGTEYHESIHVAMHLYLNRNQRRRIYREAAKKYGNLSNYDLEEKIAEEFREVMLKGTLDGITLPTGIAKFFQDILNYIKHVLGFDAYTTRLFKDIAGKRFINKPSAAKIAYAKSLRANRPAGDLTREQEREAVEIITNIFFAAKESNTNWSREEFADAIYNTLVEEADKVQGINRTNIIKILNAFDDAEYGKGLWSKASRRIQQLFNVQVLSDLDTTTIELQKKDWEDNYLRFNGKDTVSNQIKVLIKTTPNGTSTSFGLHTFLDFDTVYPYIERNMVGALDEQEMLERLEQMSKHDKSLLHIKNELQKVGNENLLAAWYSHFNRQVPNIFFTGLKYDDAGIDINTRLTNNNDAKTNIANDWLATANSKLEDGEIDTKLFRKAALAVNRITANYSEDYRAEVSKAFSEALQSVGISMVEKGEDLIAKALENEISNPANIRKFNGELNFVKEVLGDKLNHIYKAALRTGNLNNNTGDLKFIADLVKLYKYDLIQNSAMNVEGNLINSVTLPNFISNAFKLFKSETEQGTLELRKYLTNVANIPSMKYSNWLNKMVKFENGSPVIVEDGLVEINYSFMDNFNYWLLDGMKNLSNKDGQSYTDLSDNDWNLLNLIQFIDGVASKTDNPLGFKAPLLIPSDGGQMYYVQTQRVAKLNSKGREVTQIKDGKVLHDSELHKAIRNIAKQEIEDMKQARDLMFQQLEDGTWTLKEDLDVTKLQLHYHYIMKDGKMVFFDKSGKPTGKVFQFNNIPQLNNVEGLRVNGIINVGAIDQDVIMNYIEVIDQFIEEQKQWAVDNLKMHKESLSRKIKELELNKSFEDITLEFMLNQFITNVEVMNFFNGVTAEYKNAKDTNKRAKQMSAPGTGLSPLVVGQTFTGATISDVELMSASIDDIINSVAERLIEEKGYTERIDLDKIKSRDEANFNKFEADVYKIVSGYLAINTGDAQGYTTIDRYETILKGLGRLTPEYREYIAKIKAGVDLSSRELAKVLQPIKGFYYAREYDPHINRFVSVQIKYSTVPLIAQLTRGTDMDKLRDSMSSKGLDEVFFESAAKVGAKNITSIHNEDGNIIDYNLGNLQARTYYNKNWQLQLDVPEHLEDADNKLGTQIAKLVIANLHPNVQYTVNGVSKSSTALINQYFDILVKNIEESSKEVIERIGGSINEDGTITIANEEVKNILLDEIVKRGVADNYEAALDFIDGTDKFKLPLFVGSMANKWESILTSLFTNNVNSQRFPGPSTVQLSGAFLNNAKGKVSQFIQSSNDESSGIEWSREILERGDNKLRCTRLGEGVIEAEVVLGAWSSKFFKAGQRISIDEIPESLRTMVAYRIPSQAKHSMVVFKVVGFLPQESGSTIIMPDEIVAQTGSDFDIDKVFIMQPSFYMNEVEETVTEEYENEEGDKLTNEKKIIRKVFTPYVYSDGTSQEETFDRYYQTVMEASASKKGREVRNTILAQYADDIQEIKNNIIRVKGDRWYINESKRIRDEIVKGDEYWNMQEEELGIIMQLAQVITQQDSPYTKKELKIAHRDLKSRLKPLERELKTAVQAIRQYRTEEQFFKSEQRKLNSVIEELVYNEMIAQGVVSNFEQYTLLPALSQNTKAARNNQILEIYKAILTNPVHLKEIYTPAEFKSFVELKNEIDKIVGYSDDKINPSTYQSQTEFRKRNMAGRTLKGIAANLNAFGAIAQVSGMELSKPLGFVVELTSDNYDLGVLRKRYEGSIVKDNGNSIVVRLTKLGFSNDGYLNINSELILEHASQGIGAAVDVVKDPTFSSFNANTYTYPTMHAMMLAGLDARTAGMFIRQPIIKDLTDKFFEGRGILVETNEKIMHKVKSAYQVKLLELTHPNIYKAKLKKAKGNPDKIGITSAEAEKYFNVKANVVYPININKLRKAIVDDVSFEKLSKEDKIAYYKEQLKMLENFKRYRQSGELVNTMASVTKSDNSGPKTTVTHKLLNTINKLGNPLSKRNILINNRPAIEAIYPKHFNSDNLSVYPASEAFVEHGNKVSLQLIGKYFLHETAAFRSLSSRLFSGLGLEYNEDIDKKLQQFVQAYVLKDLEFLQTDVALLTGIKEVLPAQKGEVTIENFRKMSAARQLAYVKRQNPELLDNTNILSYLVPDVSQRSIEKNEGMKVINFNNVTDAFIDNSLVDSFEEMWTSTDPYLKTLAESLVKYSYHTTGFNFGMNSFSKLIPVSILTDIGVSNELYNQMSKASDRQMFDDSVITKFIQNNWNNTQLVPKVKTEYARTDNGELRKDEDGYVERKYKHNDWKPKNGIIEVDYDAYDVPAILGSSLGMFRYEKWSKKEEEFIKESDYIYTSISSNSYAPIAKLGIPTKLMEFGDISILKDRNPSKSVEQYSEQISGNYSEDSRLDSGEEETLQGFEEKRVKLEESFAKVGIKAEVVLDADLDANANVSVKDGKIVISINPKRIFTDTLIHEYGHIYIDLLGYNSEIIQTGINQLRGSALWKKVQERYPELSGERLEKEVLATAIGIEGALLSKELNKPAWLVFLNKLFRTVGELFGVKPNVAKLLAEQMLSNDLQADLYGKLSDYVQESKGEDALKEFYENKLIHLNKQVSKFKDSGTFSNELKELITKIDTANTQLSLNELRLYAKENMARIAAKFEIWDKTDWSVMSEAELKEKERAYTNFLYHSKVMFDSFTDISQLDVDEFEDDVKESIKKLKKALKGLEGYKTKWKKKSEKLFRDKLTRLSSNPDVVNKLTDIFSAQLDESYAQRWLDALADTNNTFIGTLMKDYDIHMHEKNMKQEEMLQEWRSWMKKLKAAGIPIDTFFEVKNGQKTGKFIQQYDGKYKDEMFTYINKLKELKRAGKKEEHTELLTEYFNWRRDNLLQKYTPEYYALFDKLTPDAKQARMEVQVQKDEILEKYRNGKGEYDINSITEEDWDSLKALDEELKFLKSYYEKNGKRKKGKALDIAKSMTEFSEAYSEAHEKILRDKEFRKQFAKFKKRGGDEFSKWLARNTKEEFTDEFWTEYSSIISSISIEHADIEAIQKELRSLKAPYRDIDGIVDGTKIPKDVIDKIEALEQRLKDTKRILKKGLIDPQDIKEAMLELAELVEYIPTEYYDETLIRNKANMSAHEFDLWYNANHELDYNGDIKPISIWVTMRPKQTKHINNLAPNSRWYEQVPAKAFHNKDYREDENGFPLPASKWLNNDYDKILDSKLKQEFFEYMGKNLGYLVEHTQHSIIKDGFLPAIPTDQRGYWQAIKEATVPDIKKMREQLKDEDEYVITDENNKQVLFVPFHYVKKLNQMEYKKVPTDATDEQREAIEKENIKIREENSKLHADSLDYNLEETMEMFIATALNHKFKKELESQMLLAREVLTNQQVIKKKGQNDLIAKRDVGVEKKVTVSAEQSNILAHYSDWLKMVFYEDFQNDEGLWQDIANGMQNFVSLKGIGFNILSGINNKVYGEIQIATEAGAKQFFGGEDWRKGTAFYATANISYIADTGKKESTSIQNALIRHFDVLQSQDELIGANGGAKKSKLHRLKMLSNAAYFLQHIGEHTMQNKVLFAMMNSYRLVNGKLMNLEDYKRTVLIAITKDMSKTQLSEAISKNKQLKQAAETEFKKFDTLLSMYELRDGYAKLKESKSITNEQVAVFKRKVIGLNQHLHGIYNKEDAGALQKYALGRLSIQFRKWMRPGWNKRFGSKFGKTEWNERREMKDEGMYVTTAKAAWNIIKGYKDIITSAKLEWHSMDSSEQANIRRTFIELNFMLGMILVGTLIAGMADDDEEENMLLNILIYQHDRTETELLTYTPMYGWFNEGKKLYRSPAAALSAFEGVIKLGTNIFMYPFRDEEERVYKGGVRHGEDKLGSSAIDLVPVWNQIERLSRLENSNKYYKLM